MRNLFANLCLLLVSCVAGLALCELSLRLFYPTYRDLADAQLHFHARRIWARTPNFRDWMHHPDTGLPHPFYHNNLALRQHRNFSAADLAATNIGVFGDSFTENSGMPVHYSFTEPLDYLLNQSGTPFNVLNFGVDGYGPGQSLLHYEQFRYAEDLDHVLYVFCINDLWNLYETGLFHLDETGHLERNAAIRSSWWVALIRRLQTTYLVLDVSGRWASFLAAATINREDLRRGYDERVRDERWQVMVGAFRAERLTHDDPKNSLAIFRQLVRHWKHLVERNDSTFSVVLLPNDPPPPFVVALLQAEDVEVIDLHACFGEADPTSSDRPWKKSPYRFKKDHHWNEAGNRLAAVCLYRVLAEQTGLPPLSESRLREALFQYYATFRDEPPLQAGEGGSVSLETAAAVREKYTALEMNTLLKDIQEDRLDSIVQSEKRIITSYFDVYFDRNHLIYVKEECRPADTQAGFFVHGIPVNNGRFRDAGLPFDHWRFRLAWRGVKTERHGCVAKIPLPRYRLRYIRTGQFVPGEGRLWEGEGWTDPDRVGDERPEFPGAAGTRIIASHFDVYLDGRDLVYHKAHCGPADREAPFFLHVTPVAETDLPPERGASEFHNLDFQPRSAFRVDEFGCTIARRIPGYALRHIRTGQSVEDPQGNYVLLWEGEFSIAQGAGGEEGGH